MGLSPDEKREAFEKEAIPYLDTVYRVALRLAGDSTQTDYLTQETMLKAYKTWYQYKWRTNVRAWLLTILRHTFINECRRKKNRETTVDVTEFEQFTVFHDVQKVNPEGRFFDKIVDEEVVWAIDQLPEDCRECLVLSNIADLSYAEIAAVMKVPVGTVKSRLIHTRQALQRVLYDYAVEAGYIKRSVRGHLSPCKSIVSKPQNAFMN